MSEAELVESAASLIRGEVRNISSDTLFLEPLFAAGAVQTTPATCLFVLEGSVDLFLTDRKSVV